jgi:peptide/nickel transport system substrate-binding protein
MTLRRTLTTLLVALTVALPAATSPAFEGPQRGGVARFDALYDVDSTDPALDYLGMGWQIEYATCVKLVNYRDASGAASQLVPEAAAALPTVTNGGRTYTFRVPPDRFQFSPPSNEYVTARTFQFVANRLASPVLQSPAQPFIADIVGAKAVMTGKATTISGIRVDGDTLSITLVAPHPDFLARVAMPFWCALPTTTPTVAGGVDAPPQAGPYYIAAWTPGREIVLDRNPNYHGDRPANLDSIVYTIGVDQHATLLEIEAGQADYAVNGLVPADYCAVASRFGPHSAAARRGHQQLFVNPSLTVTYFSLNTSRGLFRGATNPLRQAANYAIDRPALLQQLGCVAGQPTDQILPPGMPGYRPVRAYPLTGPRLAKARSLAGKGGRAVLYTWNAPDATALAQVVQADLAKIGIRVAIKEFTLPTETAKTATRSEPFDIALRAWGADYPDPFDFVNVLLDGDTIRPQDNQNTSYFHVGKVDAQEQRAALATGAARVAAYAALDAEITFTYAPWIAIDNPNGRDFFSARIGGQVYQPAYGIDIAALYIRS